MGITARTCTAGNPRGSVDGTDEHKGPFTRTVVSRSTTDDRGRTRKRVRGPRKTSLSVQGLLQRLRCGNTTLSIDEWEGPAPEHGLRYARRLRLVRGQRECAPS